MEKKDNGECFLFKRIFLMFVNVVRVAMLMQAMEYDDLQDVTMYQSKFVGVIEFRYILLS